MCLAMKMERKREGVGWLVQVQVGIRMIRKVFLLRLDISIDIIIIEINILLKKLFEEGGLEEEAQGCGRAATITTASTLWDYYWILLLEHHHHRIRNRINKVLIIIR